MIDMRLYRRLDHVTCDNDRHNIYVTVRGKVREQVFKAKTALEDELGDRISWQVFLSEMAGHYLRSKQ
jgi:NTP pyrophosphatase (non-canonical NTP hydrolase)